MFGVGKGNMDGKKEDYRKSRGQWSMTDATDEELRTVSMQHTPKTL